MRTRLVQGVGSVDRIGDLAGELGSRRALIVTDPGIVEAGHVARARRSLGRASVESAVFSGACENPSTVQVDAAVEAAREFSPDLLIGLGGGSSMDTAKGCNFILAGGGRMQDYWGTGKGRGEFLPMIAVPTTGGTGSEMQSYALISDAETHVKMACGDPRATCAIAILDPELTVTQPSLVTAVTGIDAISHAVETWVCSRRNPVSMMLGREAFRLLVGAFPGVLRDPGSIQARADMQLGAAFAGLAIENSMLGAAHALANPVTSRFGTIHGQSVGITLPHVVRFNGEHCDDWYRDLLESAGHWRGVHYHGQASGHLAGLIAGWVESAGLKSTLADCGVRGEDLPQLGREAVRQWTVQFNPRAMNEGDAVRLYGLALGCPD